MLIALHHLKQFGKQKLTKIWLQMSNQSVETDSDWLKSPCRCVSVLTHFVMMNTSRDSAARSTRGVVIRSAVNIIVVSPC